MPLTDAQLNANRQNAEHSTGPRTPEGKHPYDKHKQGFFEDFKPRGSAEIHLTLTVADKQWQIHHASSLLQSIQVLGQFELQDKINVDHPEIHAALTAGLVAMDKCKQLDLISRYASRLQRDYRNALKDLQAMQSERRQREQQELADAALIRKFYQMQEIAFTPLEFGFVLSVNQIDTYNHRSDTLAEAAIARDLRFNREKYHAATGT